MANKDVKPLAGFDVLGDFLVGPRDGLKPKDDDMQYQDIDPDDLQKKLDGEGDIKKVDKPVDIDDKKGDTDDNKKDSTVKKDDEPPVVDVKSDDDKEYESEISSFFAGELSKKLGISDDIDDVKFDTIDDVLELMGSIIEENSKPTYASDEVEAYDEFVRNGGDLKSFYNEVYEGKLDLDALDLEKEYDQRAVIRENLLNQGYKEDKIKKMISRYEESETLKDEAEDSLDLLKEFNDKKKQSLLVEQKKAADQIKIQQQRFYENVNSTIKTISDFRGFPVSEKEKRELLQYAFAPDEDGLTQYQRDFRSDVYNILESAYFAKNRDKAKPNNASNKRDTEAYKTLKDRLKARSVKKVDNKDDSKGSTNKSSLGDFGKGIFF